jgi:RHS repeat-associated protein
MWRSNAYTRKLNSKAAASYYRARYYDPTAGRFLSEDPLEFEGGLNLCSYASDDPDDWRDPDGTQRDRGRTGKASGTDNPFKKLKPDPDDPTKVIRTDPDGKKTKVAKPAGFQEWWDKKHPVKKPQPAKCPDPKPEPSKFQDLNCHGGQTFDCVPNPSNNMFGIPYLTPTTPTISVPSSTPTEVPVGQLELIFAGQ